MKLTITLLLSTLSLATKISAENKAQVSTEWQSACENKLQESQTTEALGLFSYSGWVDVGQICIIGSSIHWAKPGQKPNKPFRSQNLNSAQSQIIKQLMPQIAKLKDFESQTFDGVQFEIVTWKKIKEKIEVQKRVFMNNPTKAPWTSLIEQIQGFMPSAQILKKDLPKAILKK